MKIAFDLRALDGASRFRGIGIYITELVNSLFPLLKESGYEVVVYTYKKKRLVDMGLTGLKGCTITEVQPPLLKRLPRPLTTLFSFNPELRGINSLPDLNSVDVFFQPYHYFGIPTKHVQKTVVVGYDLVPLLFAEEYFKTQVGANPRSWVVSARAHLQKASYLRALRSFNDASSVVAISNQTKEDLVNHLNVSAEKVSVIYLGAPDKVTKGNISKEYLKKLSGKYVAYIGGIDGRRDLVGLAEQLIESYPVLKVKLLLAGRDFENIRDSVLAELVSKGIEAGVIINLGYINESEKRELVERSLAIVYPTLYEGFGINLLEAFEYNTPIITYKNSSLPEVGGEAALYVDSISELVTKVGVLKDDTKLRKEYVMLGKAQVKKFNWEKTASETFDLIKDLL